MEVSFGEKFVNGIKHAWNLFSKTDQDRHIPYGEIGGGYGLRPDKIRFRVSNDRSIISSIYTRIGIDVSSVDIRHVRLDGNRRFKEEMNSGLNRCFTIEANIDQTAAAFKLDMVLTMFDQGHIAVVPVETSDNMLKTGSYDILNLRVGEVVNWYPQHVRIRLYNEKTGLVEEVTVPKKVVALVENPLYNVMNEPNSILQRLLRKLSLLDSVDEQAGAGKLDLIIQLPYVIKTESKREQAEIRRKDIETQLSGSKYGIAYTDGTERITQLNRPAENNMLKQVEYLTGMLYSQLGLTESVFNGTASEAEMLNYHNRTIAPILRAITQEIKRKFLTKTAMSQGQSIEFYRDPFQLVSISQIADLADKLVRNEITTANEVRAIIGLMPSEDPKADQLRNANMPTQEGSFEPIEAEPAIEPEELPVSTAPSNGLNLDTPEPLQIEPPRQHTNGLIL